VVAAAVSVMAVVLLGQARPGAPAVPRPVEVTSLEGAVIAGCDA